MGNMSSLVDMYVTSQEEWDYLRDISLIAHVGHSACTGGTSGAQEDVCGKLGRLARHTARDLGKGLVAA